MTKAIADILGKKWDEPPEIQLIKDYVREQLKAEVSVGLQDKQLIIKAPNAALAATLRMHLQSLRKLTPADKRLVIRIGS